MEGKSLLTPEEIEKRKAALAEAREMRRQERRKHLWMSIIVIVVSLLVLSVSFYISYRQGSTAVPVTDKAEGLPERITVLFIGIDSELNGAARADTLILGSFDLASGKVGLLSIPRDTRVHIPGTTQPQRINAAHGLGGPALVKRTVANLLGVPVNYYVRTDFEGFRQIIDTLGGVEVDVTREMNYVDTAQNLHIHLEPGKQVLDGDKALQFVRYRDGLGDISLVNPNYQVYAGRVDRQREFVLATLREILKPRTIPKLPTLLKQIWRAVDTDLPLDKVLSLSVAASRFSSEEVETAVLPGTGGRVGGVAYWLVDQERVEQVVDVLIKGKEPPLTFSVLNGNGQPGAAAQGAEFLQQHGWQVGNVGNADHYNYPITRVVIPSEDDRQRFQRVADALQAELVVADEENSDTRYDAVVILGRNFTDLDRSVGF